MSNSTENPKPPNVVAYILSPACDKHIEWLKNVFGARQVEMFRTKNKSKVMHVSMVVNDGIVYLADTKCMDQEPTANDDEIQDTHGFWCHVELEDPYPVWKKAMENGSTVVFDLKKQYYGGELGCFRDPFGFNWGIAKASACRKPGVIPYLFLPDGECEKHIEWMEKALGAVKKGIYRSDDNLVQHCMLEVNGAPIYTSDVSGMPTVEARKAIGGEIKRFFCHLVVQDPHTLWDATVKEGAKVTDEMKLQFWGDVQGMVKDPFDFEWSIAGDTKPPTASPNGVIPYLFSPECEKHVDWIKSVFGAEVKSMVLAPDIDNKVMHCTLEVNKGVFYICDSDCSNNFKLRLEGEPRGYLSHMNVPDPDDIWKKAMANGATQVVELKDQFWGDYFGIFKDPYGFEWAVMKNNA